MIFSSAAAMGGKDTSTVEMMPMSEYASAQKGSASGSLQHEGIHESGNFSATAAPALAVLYCPYCPHNALMDMPVALRQTTWPLLVLPGSISWIVTYYLPPALEQACMPLTR